MKKKTSAITKSLLVFVLITGINACSSECEDCIEIPPAVDADAIALQNINHLIDTATASAWIARYLVYKDSICNNNIGVDSNILANSENFNKQVLLRFLCQPDCVGLDIAYGMDTTYKVHQIIYGVSTDFMKMYIEDTTGVYAAETGQICPKYCPKPNNSGGK